MKIKQTITVARKKNVLIEYGYPKIQIFIIRIPDEIGEKIV